MPKYLFTHDERDNSFPERYRVVSPGEDAESLRQAEDLTGTVLNTEAIELLDELLARCDSSESIRAELVDAPSWEFVELRFRPTEAEEAQKGRRGGGFVH